MSVDKPGIFVCYNEALDYWYIDHNVMKGEVLHRGSLEEHYSTKEAAQAAATALANGAANHSG